jgi:hypothetical protein
MTFHSKCFFQLSSIDQLANVQLKTLIADSNQIRSLRNLSGSSFMNHFSRLSLRNNRIQPEEVSLDYLNPSAITSDCHLISQIPLDEIVMTSSQFNHKFLYLYNNSWECSCKMATTFRVRNFKDLVLSSADRWLSENLFKFNSPDLCTGMVAKKPTYRQRFVSTFMLQ